MERNDDPNTNAALQTALIARQNDAFRKAVCGHPVGGFVPAGRLVMGRAVHCTGPAFRKAILARIAGFDAFTPQCDPTGRHETGVVTVDGRRVWFRIDLYDEDYRMGSAVPHDPARTRRVLTLVFAH